MPVGISVPPLEAATTAADAATVSLQMLTFRRERDWAVLARRINLTHQASFLTRWRCLLFGTVALKCSLLSIQS
jgi:hypothetical protein